MATKRTATRHGTCRWVIAPIAVRDFASGILLINETEYAITYQSDRSGARLTKPDGTQYHVDLTAKTCDCPDSTYRAKPGGCKHQLAVVAALAVI